MPFPVTARVKGSQMLNEMSQATDTSFRDSIKIQKKISTLPWTDSIHGGKKKRTQTKETNTRIPPPPPLVKYFYIFL